ncbi:hypothetical protein BRDID11002_68700 [Bradyrhizobium diazoefficiens]
MMKQRGRIALVTGGSRGLGRNTVLNLARRGVDVMFTYHSAVAEAEMVTREVEQMGRRARALQLDVGRTSTFETFVSQVREALGEIGAIRFDYLVNNAGISHHNSLEKTTEAELDDIYRVNFKGVFFLTQKLLPLMNDGGRIVNLSSGLARIIIPGSGPYGALKAAIDVLTALPGKGIRPSRDCRQRGGSRCGTDRFQRRGWSGTIRNLTSRLPG